jgi:DNA-directed RNA polymerase III subunit RPC5
MAVKEVSTDAIVIEWKPPVDDGGLEISQYIIEKCEGEQKAWIKIADVDRSIESYCLQKLTENSQYLFRVTAQNPVGVSEPLESDPVTIKGVASE